MTTEAFIRMVEGQLRYAVWDQTAHKVINDPANAVELFDALRWLAEEVDLALGENKTRAAEELYNSLCAGDEDRLQWNKFKSESLRERQELVQWKTKLEREMRSAKKTAAPNLYYKLRVAVDALNDIREDESSAASVSEAALKKIGEL